MDKSISMDRSWINRLLLWFDEHQRYMPWRENSTPYTRWISEMMLQQTRVDTVIPYFERFINAFPDIPSLAKAGEDEVMKLWAGLGYYSRARNVLKAARVMVEKHQGRFPSTEKEALALPGIGPYTSAAILSMAYGHPLPSVDGNVLRVYCRMTELEDNVLHPLTVRKVRRALQEQIPQKRPGDFNESLMELGALICLPVRPRCEQCPIRSDCQALAKGRVDELPTRIRKERVTQHHYLVYCLMNGAGSEIILRKNPPKGLLGGLWSFPMIELSLEDESKQEKEISDLAARKYRETWDLSLDHVVYRGQRKHIFSHRHWKMEVVGAVVSGEGPEGYVWMPVEALSSLAFPEVYQKVIRLITERPASI